MSLARRPLGAAGFDAPILGLGVSGPLGAPVTSAGLVTELVQAAYDGGARLFDTAPFYGRAEKRLGAALRGAPRGSYVLITKAGTERRWGRMRKDFSPAALRASLLRSLVDLSTDHIDIFLLHGPAPGEITPALGEALEAMKREGLIRAAGVCGRGAEIGAALAAGWCEVVQAPVAGAWAGKAAAAGAGFIGIEALRAASPDIRAPRRLSDFWYIARGVRRGPTSVSRSDPGDALRAALAAPGVSCVLFTTTRLAHLHANLAAAAAFR